MRINSFYFAIFVVGFFTHQQKYDSPQLLSPINFDYKNKTILLVEDRIKTGATLQFAKLLLHGAKEIKTFAVNGKADYSLYNEACFRFPWLVE
jgi:xanthine phosphoribosyltransferase